MNVVRERILSSVTRYKDFEKHKDLIAFCICSESFISFEDENNGIEADFNEVIVVVEKDWLFNYMIKEDEISKPRKYLREEYTSDDSLNWFDEAIKQNKVVMIKFN